MLPAEIIETGCMFGGFSIIASLLCSALTAAGERRVKLHKAFDTLILTCLIVAFGLVVWGIIAMI